MSHTPYSDEEAAEARIWVNRHGPPNSWTASNGTAARMIGRLLKERERLRLEEDEEDAILFCVSYCESQIQNEPDKRWRQTMAKLVESARTAVRKRT